MRRTSSTAWPDWAGTEPAPAGRRAMARGRSQGRAGGGASAAAAGCYTARLWRCRLEAGITTRQDHDVISLPCQTA